MDLEGSDGRERGEDDTNFERQVGEGGVRAGHTLDVLCWWLAI
jgi:hypothetical protein